MKNKEPSSNSTHQLGMNEQFPSKELLFKASNNMAPSKRFANLMMSEHELEKMTEQAANFKASEDRIGSVMSSVSNGDSAGKHMMLRRKSQIGSSVKKNYKSKLGNGKVVAEYLPELKCAKKKQLDESQASGREKNQSIDAQARATSSLLKQKVTTCQLTKVSKFDLSAFDKNEPESPVAEEKDEELLVDDEDSSDCAAEDSEDSEEERLAAEKRAREIKEIQEWAQANGFQVAIEHEKPQEKAERRLSKRKLPMTETKADKYQCEENSGGVPQSEKKKFPQRRNSQFDWMENWQSLSIEKEMQEFIPPPCEILEKQYGDNEPLRTGFNQGLIPISIKENYEKGHFAQGPQIVVTTQNVYNNLKRRDTLTEKREKMKKRNASKDVSQQMRKSNADEVAIAKQPSEQADDKQEAEGEQAEQMEPKEEQDQVQQVINQAMMNTETSLRHLFYLEYKKTFNDGQQNPIVYSRFGKQHYNSDDKFDPNNFQTLVRTCNLKRLLRINSQIDQVKNQQRRFTEPVSYPSGSYYRPTDANDRTLVFESRFESGNLQLVHKRSDSEYDLILQNDINSKGHTQWFYFRVANVKKGQKVKFNMLNMMKSKSLYTDGMKVLYYSEKKQLQLRKKDGEKGWHRGGEDLSYFQNNYRKENQPVTQVQQRCYYTFTFTFTFEHDDDVVYFAYSVPYTYSDLVNDLNEIQAKKLNYISRNTLCRTIAGNKCEYLTISNRVPVEEDRRKQGVIITARIHPGESVSSWMMKGVIEYLISDDPKAIELRNKFIFKVIPMLNPDGVINGNYRCSLAGCDLNRRWKYPSEILHPTIYHTKKLIARLAHDRPLALYCDLHGHSRRKNVFIYGNTISENPEAARVFPFLMSKIAQPNFSYDYSKFTMCRTKEHTARIAMWRDLGNKNPNIFTLEASFCGPKPVRHEPHRDRQPFPTELNYHFNTADFLKIGHNLCETLLLYKAEQDQPYGLQNIEYQVQQFQIQKQNMLELDEIIRQQQESEQKPPATTLAGQNRATTAEEGAKETTGKEAAATKSSAKEPREMSNQKSAKKMVTKNKTDKIDKTASLLEEFNKNGKLDRPLDKKKVKYRNIDDSDCASDSEPSDDNLDQSDIMKLIPKKLGKAKYLKGLLEKKKPVPQTEEKKEAKKKPKATLMPCMISSKKDREKQKQAEQQPKKKEFVQRSVVAVVKKGGKYRDVGTQIPYTSDGRNLSLMEQDILLTTGCKWSKIIFPGFKGVRPTFRESFISADRLMQDCFVRNNSEVRPALTTPSKKNNFVSNIKDLMQIVDSQGFRHVNQTDMDETSSLLKSVLKSSRPDHRIMTPIKQQTITPFQNEFLKNASVSQDDQSADNFLNSLQKRIQDASFAEPKSLIGPKSLLSSDYGMFSNEKMSSGKMNKELPSYQHQMANLIQKFDLKNLETVQEKVKQPQTSQFDRGSLEKRKRQPSIVNSSVTKKVVNGEIVKSNLLPKVVAEGMITQQIRNKSMNSQGGNLSAQKNMETRSSFKYVAHHMLNESQSQTHYEHKFMQGCDLTPKRGHNNSLVSAYDHIAKDKHASQMPSINKMNVKLLRQAFFSNDQAEK